MPVASGPRLGARSLFLVGGTILAIAVVLVFMVVYLADNGNQVRLGKNQFDDLSAERTAERIRNDGPIQFPDVSGGSRVVILSHVGENPLVNWFVFDARAAGARRECLVDWIPERELFVDRCDPTRTFPLDGEGLRQYAVRVDPDLRLVIDFNVDPLTTTTVVVTTTTAAKK